MTNFLLSTAVLALFAPTIIYSAPMGIYQVTAVITSTVLK
jgi:hypothetical protein